MTSVGTPAPQLHRRRAARRSCSRLSQASELTDLGGKPLAVVTAGEGQQSGWSTAQARMATLSTNSLHRAVPATHQSLLVDERDATFSARAIADVVRAVRTRSPLPTS